MDIKQFTTQFAQQFEETDPSEFTAKTIFKELEEWTSLQALLIIGFVDETYNVKISGEDISKAMRISDLFELIKSRKQ